MKRAVFGVAVGLFIAVSLGGYILPDSKVAAAVSPSQTAVNGCKKADFFGLVPWYNYMGKDLYTGPDGACDVKCFRIFDNQSTSQCAADKSDIPLILLALIDDMLRIAGLIAVIFVLYGAFKYTASQGSPDATASAQSTIVNALIGTAIATLGVVFVSFLGKAIGG